MLRLPSEGPREYSPGSSLSKVNEPSAPVVTSLVFPLVLSFSDSSTPGAAPPASNSRLPEMDEGWAAMFLVVVP